MVQSVWLFFLAVAYLFVVFTKPEKVPPPIVIAPAIEETKEVAATTEAQTPAEAPKTEPEVIKLNPVDIEVGKKIYLSTCTRCHNKDPNVKGSIGPELTDAPLEVMQHKIATGRYPDVLPAGFTPKRKTKLMTKFSQHVADSASIHAYIQSVKKSK